MNCVIIQNEIVFICVTKFNENMELFDTLTRRESMSLLIGRVLPLQMQL